MWRDRKQGDMPRGRAHREFVHCESKHCERLRRDICERLRVLCEECDANTIKRAEGEVARGDAVRDKVALGQRSKTKTVGIPDVSC